ncbi:MAG: hypothetical protein D6734_12380, partial [Candidatus Schekmanbacteria bacterium]
EVLSIKEMPTSKETSVDKNSGIESKTFSSIPLAFIRNSGELDNRVKYYEKGIGHTTLFTKKGFYINLRKVGENNQQKVKSIKIVPLGRNKDLQIKTVGIQNGTLNYLIGNDPSKWRRNVKLYKKVIYSEVYEGVNFKFYGNNNQLEYDIVIKPGADLSKIKLRYEGIKGLERDEEGNLIIVLSDGNIIQRKPHIYQIINDEYINIEGGYKIFPDNRTCGFEIASYNNDYPLVIDPILSYSSYLGGNRKEIGNSVAVDDNGNLYVIGKTASSNFPLASAFQTSLKETAYAPQTITSDAFITKVDPTGNTLLFSTYFGGNNDDSGNDIAIDSKGNIYITGQTFSSDLPVSTTIQTAKSGLSGASGTSDAFVAKLNSTGSAVEYLTYLGGSENDYANGIAIDSSGNAYIAGVTASTDFPVTSAFQSSSAGGTSDAFVAKINSSGTSLIYSTYLGGSDTDEANDIAVDSSGKAVLTGATISSDFPTVLPQWGTKSALNDAFITILSSSGNALEYSTFFGGDDDDIGNGIAVKDDIIYFVGTTYSDNLPVLTDALQANLASPGSGTSDICIGKFAPTPMFTTYYGGKGDDSGNGIAVGPDGNIYVVGDTDSSDFPIYIPSQKNFGGNTDTVVVKINSTGDSVIYSTFFGGNKVDVGNGIAVDQNGNAYITGYTTTIDDFPLSTTLQTTNNGDSDAFIAKFDPIVTGTIEVRTNLDEATFTISGPQTFTGSGKLWTTEAIAGVYTITMGSVDGYKTPNTKSKTLNVGETLIFSKTYVPTTGVITVTTNLDSASFTITGPATYTGSGKVWSQSGAPEGEYTITFTAVADYKTPDSQTDTLVGGESITFDAKYLPINAPDLKYKKIKAPKSAKRGKKVKIIAVVKNIGNEDSTSSKVKFYLSKKKSKSIDAKAIVIGSKSVPALSSGKSKSITLKKKLKKKIKKGKYYVKVYWDSEDSILESNESNNIGVSKKKMAVK